ncbi:MAG TPA: hypothetical protein VM557_02495 [Thermoanaerobaculia bacterium]|nr:hypothetical protein [Thermoanaerobaculia bacterium]
MRHILAITARELQERRLVFLAAFLAGVVTVLVAYFRSFGMGKEDSLVVGSLIMIAVFSLGTGMLGGASMLARDLVERRMSFYLARPVSMMEIWGGKMLAAVLMALLSAAIVVIPIALVGGKPLLAALRRSGDVGGVLLLSTLGAIVAVALGHYLSITLRSRSTWVALDLAAPLVLAIPIALVVHWFDRGIAIKLIMGSATALAAAFILLLWISSAVGLSRGRAELREVHKRTSIVLWGGMAVVVAMFLAFGAWVRSAGPEDIRGLYSVDPTPSGDGVIISGKMRGRADYFATFYINAEGRSERIVPSSQTKYSADGRVAVVCERDNCDAVQVLRFDGNGVSTKSTTISFRGRVNRVLSPDGSLMAAINENTFTVWDLAREQMIVSTRMPMTNVGVRRLGFVDDTTIRFIATGDVDAREHVQVHEFHLDDKSWRLASSVLREGDGGVIPSNSLATYLLTSGNGRSLHDSATGTALLTLSGATAAKGWGAFLHDDRVLFYDRTAGRLRLYTQRGDLVREIVVPTNGRLSWPGEPSPGWVALSEWEMGQDQPWKRLWLVNLETGEAIKKDSDLRAVGRWSGPSVEPGSFSSKLFVTPDHRLVYFDPFSGERRPVPNV